MCAGEVGGHAGESPAGRTVKAAMCRYQTVVRRRNISAGSARADRVSRENSSGASATQPVVPGGEPTEPAKPLEESESRVAALNRWRVEATGSKGGALGATCAGTAKERMMAGAIVETLFDRIAAPPKIQKLPHALV